MYAHARCGAQLSPPHWTTDKIRNELLIQVHAYLREHEYARTKAIMAAQFISLGGDIGKGALEDIENFRNHFFICDEDSAIIADGEDASDIFIEAAEYARKLYEKGERDTPEISHEEIQEYIEAKSAGKIKGAPAPKVSTEVQSATERYKALFGED